MAKNFKLLSLSSRGLKHKLMISVSLMSVLPLLVSVYLVSQHILPKVGFKIDILFSLAISFFIALIGFFVTKEVFDRILTVTTDAKMIAAGDIMHRLEVSSEDEVGDLGEALNRLTERIRNNMEELKTYSERTTEINLAIQKRVIVLSSLLQISSQISSADKLDDVLRTAVEKARLLANSDLAFLFFRDEGQETFSIRITQGASSDYLNDIKISPQEDAFYAFVNSNKPLILDKQELLDRELVELIRNKLKVNNALILPIFLRKRVVAMLGIASKKDNYAYAKEDIELLDIFVRQIAIAIENDILSHSVKKLEIKDTLTGLYNGNFMSVRLQEEIKRAIVYQRPCSFILLDIDNFKDYSNRFGSLQSEGVIKTIASLIRDSVSEVDRVGRIGDDEFAVILPEKNKRNAQDVAEDIRKKIEFSFGENTDASKRVTISAGVSENPLDGINSEQLISKAKELLEIAKKNGRNRVVIFKER